MGFSSGGLSEAQTLDAIVDDSTRFSGADIGIIKGKIHGFMDFWSEPVDVEINNTGADKTLGNVVIPNLSGITPIYVVAMFKVDLIHNVSGGGNGLLGDKYIQVDESAGGFTNAILIKEWLYGLPGGENRTNVIDIIGHIDIIAKVAAMNLTINFKWALASCNGATLHGHGCRTGVRVFY